jgi:hypothetical protein
MNDPEARLFTLLLQKMEYTALTSPRCDTCQHCTVEDDQGGLDHYYCDLNPAATLSVERHGRCKYHTVRVISISKP